MTTWEIEARLAALEIALGALVEEIGELRERHEVHRGEAAGDAAKYGLDAA